MEMKTVGIDVGKQWYHLIGMDGTGAIVQRQRFNRSALVRFLAKAKPCLIGMEACCGSHRLARELAGMGHDARLMSAKFVRPYLKGNKNDYLDAEAIAEAVSRPNMRFVPIKTVEQLDLQAIHRVRSNLVGERTGVINQIRSFLQDRGVVVGAGPARLARELPGIVEAPSEALSAGILRLIEMLWRQWQDLDEQVAELDASLKAAAEQDPICSRLMTIPGVGVMTATAIVASVGDGSAFRSGRDFAAWIGLVPRQRSTGGRTTLLGISKRGNRHLRTLLIHGARCMLRFYREPTSKLAAWVSELRKRAHANVTAVALANKTARIIWAIMTKGTTYRTTLAAA